MTAMDGEVFHWFDEMTLGWCFHQTEQNQPIGYGWLSPVLVEHHRLGPLDVNDMGDSVVAGYLAKYRLLRLEHFGLLESDNLVRMRLTNRAEEKRHLYGVTRSIDGADVVTRCCYRVNTPQGRMTLCLNREHEEG